MTATSASQPKYTIDFDYYKLISAVWHSPLSLNSARTKDDVLAGYSLRNESNVRNFLRMYPYVAKYVRKAPAEIKKYFKNPKLSLEVIIDPEVDNDQGILFVNIDTDEEVGVAWKKLDNLTKNWIVPVVGRDASIFNIDLDYA